jgi:hypothetical protein
MEEGVGRIDYVFFKEGDPKWIWYITHE